MWILTCIVEHAVDTTSTSDRIQDTTVGQGIELFVCSTAKVRREGIGCVLSVEVLLSLFFKKLLKLICPDDSKGKRKYYCSGIST